jgi:hypothetical protein
VVVADIDEHRDVDGDILGLLEVEREKDEDGVMLVEIEEVREVDWEPEKEKVTLELGETVNDAPFSKSKNKTRIRIVCSVIGRWGMSSFFITSPRRVHQLKFGVTKLSFSRQALWAQSANSLLIPENLRTLEGGLPNTSRRRFSLSLQHTNYYEELYNQFISLFAECTPS